MNTFYRIAALALALCGVTFGQVALTQTLTTVAITDTGTTLTVASTTGITANISMIYIYDWGQTLGELASVKRVVSSTVLTINRTNGTGHAIGAVVVIAPTANAFRSFNPRGTCTGNLTGWAPWLNSNTGEQWTCSAVTGAWVPSWGSNMEQRAPSAAVASAAGVIVPSGPFFHVTGVLAITGFTLPVGFHGGSMTIVADGAFTWTAAGNIGLASLEAMTAGGAITFFYDTITGKWYPSATTFAPTP